MKPGKYKTRDGRDVVVLCDDAPGMFSLVGYVIDAYGDSNAHKWLRSGKYHGKAESPLDLMPPKPWTMYYGGSGLISFRLNGFYRFSISHPEDGAENLVLDALNAMEAQKDE